MFEEIPLDTSDWLTDATDNQRYRLGVAQRNYQYATLSELHTDYSTFQHKNSRTPLGVTEFRKDLEILYKTSVVQSSGYRIKGIMPFPNSQEQTPLILPSTFQELQSLLSDLTPPNTPTFPYVLNCYTFRTQDLPILAAYQALTASLRSDKIYP